jgi:drug/metabolite transporter (DMT)-like permease
MKGADMGVFDLQGTALMLGAAVAMSIYAVLARKLTKQFTVYKLTLMMSLVGFLLFSGIDLGRRVAAGTLSGFFAPFADSAYVIAVLFLGVIASFLSAFLSNYALSELQASRMSVFSNLATVITILAGAVFLGESLYWYHIAGGVAIVTGVLGTNLCAPKAKSNQT